MKKITLLLAALGLATSLTAGSAYLAQAVAGGFAVIVNAANGYSEDPSAMKAQIKRLYLKQQTSWPSGEAAVAFDRAAGSPEQAAFVKGVLGMSDAEINDHWLRLKQTTGDTPPRAVDSSSIVVRQVSKNPGSFGYVAAGEALPPEVKVLFEF